MAYRTALRSASRVYALRFRLTSAYLAPAFVVVASAVGAQAALERSATESAVSCAQGLCVLQGSRFLNRVQIGCNAADATIVELVAPEAFVHHEVRVDDDTTRGREVSLDEARDGMARCVSGATPAAVVEVGDTKSGATFVWIVAGLCVAFAALRYLLGRGLTLSIDEIARELRVRDQDLIGGARSCSVPLRDVAELAVFEVFDHLPPRIGETSSPSLFVLKADGSRVEIARGRSMFDRARYQRAAARAMAVLSPSTG